MTETIAKTAEIVPSAAPANEELAAWGELPRDEQIRRLRAKLMAADCSAPSDATFGAILAEARTRADARRG